ncbi:hypothetical protein GGQ99_001624 [Aminobacter niigataensis]|uniref:Tellurite resistance protein TerB n=1 Tax=Aminobacter niigataensis TaxID=83265 RepID=A0ABR6KZH8_9HYPH|nr:hypothetical protein [Aminobacter niigataensis]MBB4649902.1 hypothetical protein [Aminobacter niigataensis]
MTSRASSLVSFLSGRMSEVPVPPESFLAGSLFQMILRGDVKLPLDRVEEVALVLGVDARQLFRLAARQFYDEEAICLFERMFGASMTNEEQKWLHEIRSAAEGHVSEPNATARRLVRALAKPQASA